MLTPQDILNFWYAPEMRSGWFNSTPELDAQIRQQFEPVWEAAVRGELDAWLGNPEGCLALAIVLDQFPLNMLRGPNQSFSRKPRTIPVAKQTNTQAYQTQT